MKRNYTKLRPKLQRECFNTLIYQTQCTITELYTVFGDNLCIYGQFEKDKRNVLLLSDASILKKTLQGYLRLSL